MKKLFLLAITPFVFIYAISQTLKSPEEFLGYKIGTRYTPHWKIVSYFQYVATTLPSTIKLLQYGETNEGRPLLATFIGTAEHMQNLESIRANNIRLANLSKDNPGNNRDAAVEDGTPAIVW